MVYNPSLLHTSYFYLPENAENPDFGVKWGGEDVCSPDYFIERKSYPFYVIELVLQGKGVFAARDRETQLAAGSVYFFSPKIPHQYYCDPAHPMKKVFIVYEGAVAGALTQQTLGSPFGAFRVADLEYAFSLFKTIQEEGLNPSRFCHEVCATALKLLLYRLASLRLTETGENSAAYQTYLQVSEFIQANFEKIVSISEWAARTNLTEAYLCRLFKKYSYQTPLTLLTRLRMNKVASLLLTTHAPVKQIAETMGFNDQFVLSKVFKKAYGVSPQQYRRLNQPGVNVKSSD